MKAEQAQEFRAGYVAGVREQRAQQRVLIIEDYVVQANAYREILERHHFGFIETASAANEGLDRARSFKPDVILLDLRLPSTPGGTDESAENGLRALDGLLKEDPFRPVVAITADDDRERMREFMQHNHGGGYVFKNDPDQEMAIVEAVVAALNNPAYQASLTVRRFEQMVSDQEAHEEPLKAFLKEHWRVILGPEYRECKSEYPVDVDAKVDLLMIRHDGTPDIWELKSPGQAIFQKYGPRRYHSVACAEAIGQVMEYIDLAEQRTGKPSSYESRRGHSFALHRPRGFVVIGRYHDAQDRDRLKLENSFLSCLTILTYDDLLERARQLLFFLRDHRNGFSLS